jgi:NAD(P)-dependent dehydrogenase (short-subunit alcohol dehydrogenase family)
LANRRRNSERWTPWNDWISKHLTHSAVTAKIKDEFMKRRLETHHLKFAGKVALITGGTRGIGAATARRVAELGADVVITGRREREGRRLVDEIDRTGGSADFVQADLTQPDQVRLVVPFTLKAFGRLDYAFNNAGIPGNNRALVDQTEENFDRVFAVNVKALFLLLQDELKQMIVQGEGGSIVKAALVGGRLAIQTAGHHVASKQAVLGLTKTAASRIRPIRNAGQCCQSGRSTNRNAVGSIWQRRAARSDGEHSSHWPYRSPGRNCRRGC